MFVTDILIIGGGAAGLTAALKLPESLQITVLTKASLQNNSTYWAQGGISAVSDASDHFDLHIADTLAAGAGLCDPAAVEYTVTQAPAIIDWLSELGMPFTREEENTANYHLTREGGHSHRRILHAADATGQALHQTLLQHVTQRRNIQLLADYTAIDLITGHKIGLNTQRCLGIYALNRQTQAVACFAAKAVILATGGANRAYLYSSNPDGSTGDGIAMAWRAGCRVGNMEFMQFHPTCLYHPLAKSFLISEAVRGEGGYLTLPNGERFMQKFDQRGELAPRDIVARAIDHEMKRLGLNYVQLDIRHKGAEFIAKHFPTILSTTKRYGFDMTQQPLPVVPAAHYTCGGICTDLTGQTDIPGLYAIGETAYTGLHGANRMASNSLLECLVFGQAAAIALTASISNLPLIAKLPPWDSSRVTDSDEEVVVSHNWHELRQTLWNYVGIVRSDKRLQRANNRITLLQQEILEYYRNFTVTNNLLELRNLVTVGELIVRSAQARQESRGLHYNLDHTQTDPIAKPTILAPEIKS